MSFVVRADKNGRMRKVYESRFPPELLWWWIVGLAAVFVFALFRCPDA